MTRYSEDVGLRLGEAIRAQRHLLGLTLVDVATRAGLSHPFLSQLERGLARPSMRSLTAIASTLGTSAQALMAAAELPAVPAAEPVSVVRGPDARPPVDSPGGTVRTLVRGERAMLPVEYTGAPRVFDECWRSVGDAEVQLVVVQQNARTASPVAAQELARRKHLADVDVTCSADPVDRINIAEG